jgi:hypothetical protein
MVHCVLIRLGSGIIQAIFACIDKIDMIDPSEGRIFRYEQHEPLMEERQRRLQAPREFGHLKEHDVVSWTEQEVPDCPQSVVEFEHGAECPVYPVCRDIKQGRRPCAFQCGGADSSIAAASLGDHNP